MPLSSDPDRRRAQLANLRPGSGQAGAGNQRALAHGGYSEALVADVSDEVRELMDALGATAPVRDADGSLPSADVAAVERVARLLRRWRKLEAWLDAHGAIVEKTGEVKPAAKYAAELGESLGRALDTMGMSPTSRARLGLDLARSFDLAAHWAGQDEDTHEATVSGAERPASVDEDEDTDG